MSTSDRSLQFEIANPAPRGTGLYQRGMLSLNREIVLASRPLWAILRRTPDASDHERANDGVVRRRQYDCHRSGMVRRTRPRMPLHIGNPREFRARMRRCEPEMTVQSILPIQPDQLALNPTGSAAGCGPRGGIGGFERDQAPRRRKRFSVASLVDQRPPRYRGVGGVVRWISAMSHRECRHHHGIATHFERVMSRAEHVGARDGVGAVAAPLSAYRRRSAHPGTATGGAVTSDVAAEGERTLPSVLR